AVGEVACRNWHLPAPVPWSLPPGKIKYTVEQVRGQPPDEMPVHFERRAGVTRRMPDAGPMRGIGEYGDGHDVDRRRLSGIHDCHRAGFAPPCDNRRDIESADFHVRGWQHPEHLDSAAVDAGLLSGFTQRGVRNVMIIRVGSAARKGNLPGMRTHSRGPFDEHDLRT